jgi:hypothetical protein
MKGQLVQLFPHRLKERPRQKVAESSCVHGTLFTTRQA